jgi:acetoin utilization deacetylase AcuC-like enzyme
MSLLFRDERFLTHETGSHPESPQRLTSIHAAIDASDLMQTWTLGPVEPVPESVLRRIHTQEYLRRVRSLAEEGGGRLDPDTVVSPQSYEVARCAVGAALAAVDAVLGGQHREAVCLVRPPGHHALPNRAMGFCLLANIALAALHAREQHELDRVLIVDWDVHHGNGTQDIFYDDGSVHFFSAHRSAFWPGTGAEDETGRGAGLGATLNLPLPFGITRQQYRSAFEHALQTAADRCKPQLVLISAGFDAHRLDPIGSLGLESEDFADLTQMVMDVAQTHCEGRIVSLLEGGYHLEALAESVVLHLRTLCAPRGNAK